jgi:ribosome biogenesis GTPase A
MIGNTNVGKSSVIAALLKAGGVGKHSSPTGQHLSPTVSVFPHTTIANVEIPLRMFGRFKDRFNLPTKASLYDTPGVEWDSSYFTSLIDHDYLRAVSLFKVSGFQRPPYSLSPGTHSSSRTI